MKAIDTNVLVRFLVNDDEKQALLVKQLLKQAEVEKDSLFIPVLVVMETLWVLSSVYGFSRLEIIMAVEGVLEMPVFTVECHEKVSAMCRIALQNDCDMADILIGISAASNGCDTVLSFDKKAAKSGYFSLIQ
jgi:predicted nucleic-acid-binding protein